MNLFRVGKIEVKIYMFDMFGIYICIYVYIIQELRDVYVLKVLSILLTEKAQCILTSEKDASFIWMLLGGEHSST